MKTKFLLISISVAGCLAFFFLRINNRQSSAVEGTMSRSTNSDTVNSAQELQAEVVTSSVVISALGEWTGNTKYEAVDLSPVPAGETSSLDRSQTASNFVSEVSKSMNPTNNISVAGDDFITEQQALVIASEAIGQLMYDKDAVISVQREPGRYVVTFPIKQPALHPGEHYRGSSYAARVIIDEKTGKVLQVKVGS